MKKTHDKSRRNISGRHIRAIRFLAYPPISQEDLAARLTVMGVNLDQGAISRIENEERYVMDYELVAIARALRVTLSNLFDKLDTPALAGRPPLLNHLLPLVDVLMKVDCKERQIARVLNIPYSTAHRLMHRVRRAKLS